MLPPCLDRGYSFLKIRRHQPARVRRAVGGKEQTALRGQELAPTLDRLPGVGGKGREDRLGGDPEHGVAHQRDLVVDDHADRAGRMARGVQNGGLEPEFAQIEGGVDLDVGPAGFVSGPTGEELPEGGENEAGQRVGAGDGIVFAPRQTGPFGDVGDHLGFILFLQPGGAAGMVVVGVGQDQRVEAPDPQLPQSPVQLFPAAARAGVDQDVPVPHGDQEDIAPPGQYPRDPAAAFRFPTFHFAVIYMSGSESSIRSFQPFPAFGERRNVRLKPRNQSDQPIWKKRCFNPAQEPSTSGMKVRKPTSMTARLAIAQARKPASDFSLCHRTSAASGERNNNTEGMPMTRCMRRGSGKIAAPPMDSENEKMISAGIELIPLSLHPRLNPITNKMLRTAQASSPVMNIYCDLVPMAPSSLTILVRWL